MGKLYVVPTPLGNLKDVSDRVREVLSSSDVVACEDTRTTGRLLSYLESDVRTVSYHMHNENSRTDDIISLLREGKTVSLVSDAGMPGISDPGHILIKKVIEEGHEVSVIPGPSAFVTALVGSGLDTGRFTFIGFLERQRSARKKELENLRYREETLIFYEAPHRLREFLSVLLEVLGDRDACLARELTKIHEEYERGLLSHLSEIYSEKEPRGEYVVIVRGKTREEKESEKMEKLSEITIEEQVRNYMAQGMSKMDAVKKTARERQMRKNDVYKEVLDVE